MEKQNDELALRDIWFAEAKTQTLETLPAFMKKLTEHPHEYGTICRAIAAAALGAAYAMEHAPSGGITGFQGGAVMWDFISAWMSIKGPAQLIKFENFLYPQYENNFKAISRDTFKWLQEEAVKKLADAEYMHPAVEAHMRAIVNGDIPFGFALRD